MAKAAKAIPEVYHTVTPYMIVHDGAGALEFYTKAFNAQERFRYEHEGKIGHAEIQIGDSVIMLALIVSVKPATRQFDASKMLRPLPLQE